MQALYTGQSLSVRRLPDGLAELCFDRSGLAINKLDRATMAEWQGATHAIASTPDLTGVLVTSAKDDFIVGADILEFGELFSVSESDLSRATSGSHQILNAFEDLSLPTVVAINGFALGGGLEMTLTGSMRVMSSTARIGVPEISLGIFPGFGGTVRLSRLAGVGPALDWITSGKPRTAEQALQAGVVDEVVEPQALRERALDWLRRAVAGQVDWRAARAKKLAPVAVELEGAPAALDDARRKAASRAGRHEPASAMAVELIANAMGLARDEALQREADAFAKVAKTQAAASLVQMFHTEQAARKRFKAHADAARPVRQVAVLGAGIMGAGIAYTNAASGVPVTLHDASAESMRRGLERIEEQVSRQLRASRLTQEQAQALRARVTASSALQGVAGADMVIEAVVESLAVKHSLITELERLVAPDTVIASNTSSLRIDDIAQAMQRPEQLVGMHFFNPVPVMPLVEIIKGKRTSDAAVATAVAHGLKMGKKPIVVTDCPGFLVNRVITPYLRSFLLLISEGCSFEKIDRAMEAFGWPMGPAYLEDVVGMDTGSHVLDVIRDGYAERMPRYEDDALKLLVRHGRLGQKSGLGFYRYAPDEKGRLVKAVEPGTHELLAELRRAPAQSHDDQAIVQRMMLPMLIEAARALEEGVVGTAEELDLALTLGIGFPAYLGGALKYADWLGMKTLQEMSRRHAQLGPEYMLTERMADMAARGRRYYA